MLGISVDSPFALSRWARDEGYLDVTLLSDLGKEVCRAYDSMYEELLGLKGVAKRSAFLLDESGNLMEQEILDDARQLPDLERYFQIMNGGG